MAFFQLLRTALLCGTFSFLTVAGLLYLVATPVAVGSPQTTISIEKNIQFERPAYDANLRQEAILRLQNNLSGSLRKTTSNAPLMSSEIDQMTTRTTPSVKTSEPETKRLPRII